MLFDHINTLFDQIRAIDNIEDRLKLITETNHIDFDMFPQKSCLLIWVVNGFDNQISDVQYANDLAYRIALAFKNKFGAISIERESSYCLGTFRTVMDDMLDDSGDLDDPVAHWLIRIHMKALNFKKNTDLNPFYLYRMYCDDSTYPITDELFSELKRVKCKFGDELKARYLYHPNKVETWLMQNPNKDVLEYPN
jgi:hypothetical protein